MNRFSFLALLMLGAVSGVLAQTPVAVVQPVAASATRTLELSGSFVARRAARLSPRLSGLVTVAPVDTGDRVAAGTVVLQLDGRLAELAMAEAEASRNQARSRLAEAERLAAEVRRLAADQFVAETQIAAREAEVGVMQASLGVAEAALATARERLARHAVIAPFDGVIANRLAEVGEWVETGTAVVELVATDALWLDARAPQQFWNELDGDVRAVAFVDALGREVPVTLHARVPVSDPAARTFLVRLTVDEDSNRIVPGMSAKVRFAWSANRRVVYVPRDAIIRFPDGTTTVWVVEDGDDGLVAREREVSVVRFDGDRAELSTGLDPDQRVVVRGNEVLTEGESVRVTELSR